MRPLALMLVVLAVPFAAAQEKKAVQPVRSWTGRLASAEKEPLLKEAPTTGYLDTQAGLDKLWAAWRGDEKPPAIDFKREVVFVHTAKGPNALKASYSVDAAGDLKVIAATTLVAGPGFGYVIDVLPRDAFKTYRGKALGKAE